MKCCYIHMCATAPAAGARRGGAAVRGVCHPGPHPACAHWAGYRARGPVWRVSGRHWLGALQRLKDSALQLLLPAQPSTASREKWHEVLARWQSCHSYTSLHS